MSVRYWTLFFESPSCYMSCICSTYNGQTFEGAGTDLKRQKMVVSFLCQTYKYINPNWLLTMKIWMSFFAESEENTIFNISW